MTLGSRSAPRADKPRWRIGQGRLRGVMRSPIFGSMSIITVAMAMRLALQILVFGIVATAMGAGEFGAFASVAALAGIFSAFSGWGSDQLLLRRVGRAREELPRALATTMAFVGLSAPPLVLLALAVVPFAIDSSVSWQLVLYISLADIGLARISGLAGVCYQAVGRPMGNLRLSVGFGVARVIAAVVWVSLAQHHDAVSWSRYYFGISALAVGVSIWLIWRDLGAPEWKIAWHEWRDGFHFALQTASQTAFGSTDKPVIAALADLPTAGLYAAASRIVNAAAIPVNALLFSAYVKFFQVGVSGPRNSARLAVRLLPAGMALGVVGAVGTLVMAPLAPRILGHSYMGTDVALMILAPLPVLRAILSLGLDVLVSTGRTGLRTLAQIAMPLVNILLCVLLVPAHGAAGAALAALLAHAGLTVGSWVIVAMLVRQQAAQVVRSVGMDKAGREPLAG